MKGCFTLVFALTIAGILLASLGPLGAVAFMVVFLLVACLIGGIRS